MVELNVTRYNQRARNWARNFMMRGVVDRFAVMASPPTLTKGTTTTSSVNASYVNNSVQFNGQDARLSWLGGPYEAVTKVSIPTRKLSNVTLSTAAKTGTGLTRIRFMTHSEAIDVALVESNALDFNVIADGQMARRSRPFGFANTGNVRWVKTDFGTNVITYALDTPPSVTSGGTGYVVDEIITLNGGGGSASGTPARLRVAQVSSGVITSVTVEEAGAYASQVTGSFGQASTTGAGTGATFSSTFQAARNSTRKMRTIELLIRGASDSFLGVVLTTGATILPAPVLDSSPSVLIVGDSMSAATYPAYAGCEIASTLCQRAGLWDRHSTQAQGGTGWNQANVGANARAWMHADRLADIIAAAPDIVIFLGSQNDTAGTALEDAMAAGLATLQAGLPNALFVGVGNILGDSTALAASLAAGWARAPDQTRTRFINNHSPKWIPSAQLSQWYEVGDVSHLSADGVDWWSSLAATQIASAICDMALP